ncbi:MAG: dihydroorotase [Marinilabiliaceae bacterium]|nr:dihydroorotase [Marinilabiliaceae bacterium]
MKTLIKNATVINEGETFKGSLLINGEHIEKIFRNADNQHINNKTVPLLSADKEIDAENHFLIPGIIDSHVHFRQPGLTHKGDIFSESRAAIAGGITSFMDMPNTIPQTTTVLELEKKFEIASQSSLANYSFFIGATNNNFKELLKINRRNVCGVKLFMGASTGNMRVDNNETLENIFKEVNLPISAHCEDESIINANFEKYRKIFSDNIPYKYHSDIRDEEACYRSTAKAVELAEKYNSKLNILHISTERELSLLNNNIPLEMKKVTGEVCVHYLWFDNSFFDNLEWRIKCNPSIKTFKDRDALRKAIIDNKIDLISTDHAPHTIEEKQQPYIQSPSGLPLVQHSLLAIFELTEQEIFTKEKAVEKMCHAPAKLFSINKRGFIREGYYADIVLIKADSWTAKDESSFYKCKWTPFSGVTFLNMITHTFVNGHLAYESGKFNDFLAGQRLSMHYS